MKPKHGIKKRIAERNDIKDDRQREESEGTKRFILAKEQRSWQEAVDIIAREGSIRLIAV